MRRMIRQAVVGLGHDFVEAMNGFVTEASSIIEGLSVSVIGDCSNRATDLSSSVSGGVSIGASGADSSVVGGRGNDAADEGELYKQRLREHSQQRVGVGEWRSYELGERQIFLYARRVF